MKLLKLAEALSYHLSHMTDWYSPDRAQAEGVQCVTLWVME